MALIHHLDVQPTHLATLHRLLDQHLPGVAVWAYGSRINGTARSGSDLDLVVFVGADQFREVAALREALDESNIPFIVDLFVWNEIPQSFRDHINSGHVVVREG